MRYIVIPSPVQVIDPRTKSPVGEPRSFIDCAYDVWLNDNRVSEKGPMKVRRWGKVVDKFEKYKEAGDVVTLDDEDWDQLREIVESPKAFYPPLVAVQLDAFASCILDAGTEDPRPKAKAIPVEPAAAAEPVSAI